MSSGLLSPVISLIPRFIEEKKNILRPDVAAHASNFSIQEAETGGSL